MSVKLVIPEYLTIHADPFYGMVNLSFLSVCLDKDMILVTGKIPYAKIWQDLGETGKAKVPKIKELAPSMSELVLSGQAAEDREKFWVEDQLYV